MAQNKNQMIAAMVVMSMAMQAFVTGNALCPSLDDCAILPFDTQCCSVIKDIADTNQVQSCLCDVLKTKSLGQTLGNALGLPIINSLPIIGGLVGDLLGHDNGITSPVLDKEILALVNGCGFDAAKYHCDAF